MEAGACGYVLKPFSEHQLVTTIRGVLAEREAEHHHVRVLIEHMLRDGREEREIVAAVHRELGTAPAPRWRLRRP